MALQAFFYLLFPVFLLWILYQKFVQKENFLAFKEALYTGLFSFAVMGILIYILVN